MGRALTSSVDLVITNAIVLDHWGVVKADVGVRDGRIAAVGKTGNPGVMDGVHPDLVIGPGTEVLAGEPHPGRGRGRLERPSHLASGDRGGATPAGRAPAGILYALRPSQVSRASRSRSQPSPFEVHGGLFARFPPADHRASHNRSATDRCAPDDGAGRRRNHDDDPLKRK